ncbi:reverse transcriptase domain-containing protein [Tanacetum coccineum]|uniref:Reverse transcriptase domain-containing protein n=1 Tax=Tanacetum coccineum TaxID=301880 RepID=A0ABQ5B6I9_9ASTR
MPLRLQRLLTLTPQLGPRITSGARLTRLSFLLAGMDNREETPPPLTKEQIEGHVSALKSLIKSHNRKNKGDPIRLDLEMVDTEIFQQTLDGSARGWFKRLPHDSINEWADLREAFAAKFSVRRVCFKEPHEITKIVRRANESLTTFKERWTVETGFIMGVPEVMKITSFMDSLKSPDLAKRFSDKVPTTVNEIMERLDDFVRFEEAYANMELPKGETGESYRKVSFPSNGQDTRPFRSTRPMESQRDEYNNNYRRRDTYRAARARDDRAPHPYPRGEYNRRDAPEKGHYTNDCIQLRKQLEIALESKKLNHLVKDVRQRGRGSHGRDDPQQAKIINVISVNSVKDKKQKVREATESWMNVPISFPAIYSEDIFEEPLIVEEEVEGYLVRRVYVDEGSSIEVMFEHCFKNLNPKIKGRLKETRMDLVGFTGEVSKSLGKIELEAIGKKTNDGERRARRKREVAVTEEVLVNPSFPDQLVTIGGGLSEASKDQLKHLLKDKMVVFAWDPSDMTGVPRRIIEHALNVNPSLDPVCQKRRTFSMEKSGVVTEEVAEWVKAGIVRPVKYPTYISNPVLVKKGDGTWSMCIDFKNLNSACPKDYYPLPNIDCKVESVMGFKYKCFLDAYKGYHQIQMAKEDEEKTAFYTDQGTYCYTKMLFGLKNVGTTYQRLVDSTFQPQIGRNMEAYVDDMVIKSRDEKMLLADIAETFDNLKKNNMKLNPKKYSFRVEEGKFLGYMVTSEGIRANPKKIRALADLQSPRTLKKMQSLNGKLASLSRFLAKSAERSLPFLNTLKNINKENKHKYRWTQEVEAAFQQMKRLITELPSLTPPREKETLYAYLAVSAEAVSAVLLTDRKGRQCPIQYVSRTLNEDKINYAPMEKLALSLIHMTRRLRRYFEAHPVKVITDQPIKNILNNTETSKKLAKYVVELGAYNIKFIPRNAVKGQVLADFLSEAPEGTKEDLYFRMPEVPMEKDDTES